MKKLLTVLFAVCMAVCLGLAFTGCGEEHTHTYAENENGEPAAW